jgi:hypothetical protein
LGWSWISFWASVELRAAARTTDGSGRLADRCGAIPEHLVQLWLQSDADPSNIDWGAWLPKTATLQQVEVRTFPWRGVEHEITWWITRRLTLKEWSDLDNSECQVLTRIVGAEHFAGTAGPVPEDEPHLSGNQPCGEIDDSDRQGAIRDARRGGAEPPTEHPLALWLRHVADHLDAIYVRDREAENAPWRTVSLADLPHPVAAAFVADFLQRWPFVPVRAVRPEDGRHEGDDGRDGEPAPDRVSQEEGPFGE